MNGYHRLSKPPTARLFLSSPCARPIKKTQPESFSPTSGPPVERFPRRKLKLLDGTTGSSLVRHRTTPARPVYFRQVWFNSLNISFPVVEPIWILWFEISVWGVRFDRSSNRARGQPGNSRRAELTFVNVHNSLRRTRNWPGEILLNVLLGACSAKSSELLSFRQQLERHLCAARCISARELPPG